MIPTAAADRPDVSVVLSPVSGCVGHWMLNGSVCGRFKTSEEQNDARFISHLFSSQVTDVLMEGEGMNIHSRQDRSGQNDLK